MGPHHTHAPEVADRGRRLRLPIPRPRRPAWARLRRTRQAHPLPLPTTTGAYVAFAALLLFPSTLKLIKAVAVTEGGAGLLDLIRVVCPDIALACASLGVGLLLVRALRPRRRGAWVFGAMTTLYLLVLLMLSALEHQAWARSASLLDWNIFWYTIEHYAELRIVIAAETTTAGVLLLVGAGLLALAPVLVDLLTARLLGLDAGQRTRESALWLLASLVPAWVASGAPSSPELYPLTQSASLGLLAGALEAAEEGSAAAAAPFKAADAERAKQRIDDALAAAQLSIDSEGKPKNVLLVVLESTRFDATSVHVPHLNTTPKLRAMADEGITVDRAYVDMPHTSKALVSILCGYTPKPSVQIGEAEPGGLPSPCLAHVYGALGYRRGFFQAATGTYENRHQLALNAGYEEVFTRESYDESGFEETNYLSVEDKVMVKPILRWIDSAKRRPFFLTVLTCITHHSYGLPTDFRMRQYPRRPARIGGRMPRPWSDYNRYLNTVQYADQFLAEVMQGLRQRKLLSDTLIVVVGDHGQAFHEHGQKAHNTVIWEEGLRVPLVLFNRRAIPEPKVVEGVRRQVDIAPTVLELTGVRHTEGFFDGKSLISTDGHEKAYSQCWYDQRCAAETGPQYRFIDHYDNQPMEVFDLAADPFERRNLLEVGSPEEREHWKAEATAARDRIAKHQEEASARFQTEDAGQQPWILAKEPRPAHRVRVRLEDQLELIGYDAPSMEVSPDGFWEAVIYFKCLKPSDRGWRMFGMLRTVDGREHQVDHHPANGRFYLSDCKPGTIVADHVRVWIPGDFPPGEVSYYWGSVLLKDLGHVRRTNKRLGRRRVIPLERGVLIDDRALRLATLRVQPEYRENLAELRSRAILKEPPQVDKPLNVRFGDNLVLVDAYMEPSDVRRLASATVTTVWRVDGPVKGPWQLLVHMDSHRPGYWLRRAHTPVDGTHPIANWEPGTWVVDNYNLPIPEQMPRGDAHVWVGIRTSRKRMKVTDANDVEITDHRALIGTIRIMR